jgi:hypothetical protein
LTAGRTKAHDYERAHEDEGLHMAVRAVTEQEVAEFNQTGWTFLPQFVDTATVAGLRARGEKALQAYRRVGDYNDILDRNFRPFPGEGYQDGLTRDTVMSPVMGRNMTRLLRVPQVRLYSQGAYLLKQPENESAHEDTLYHQDFVGNPVDRSGFLTIWIALHDLTADAGTLRFYNRSHRLGVFGHVFMDGICLRKRCDELKDEDLSPPLSMRAGDATAHHSLTVHGAPPNKTDGPRWAYALMYMDSESRYTYTPGQPLEKPIPFEPFAKFDHPSYPIVPLA